MTLIVNARFMGGPSTARDANQGGHDCSLELAGLLINPLSSTSSSKYVRTNNVRQRLRPEARAARDALESTLGPMAFATASKAADAFVVAAGSTCRALRFWCESGEAA